MPYHSLGDKFVGRVDSLWQLYDSLHRDSTAILQGTGVVVGTGGLGKTQLAIEYVHRFGVTYSGSCSERRGSNADGGSGWNQRTIALNPRTRSRLVKVVGEDRPAQAAELLSSRFDRLPDGVELTPHSLHIDFQGREEFLERLGAVVLAL